MADSIQPGDRGGDGTGIVRGNTGDRFVQRRGTLSIRRAGQMGEAYFTGPHPSDRQRPFGERRPEVVAAERAERDQRAADQIVTRILAAVPVP